eukprot:2573462-Rhodomonas_salina.3
MRVCPDTFDCGGCRFYQQALDKDPHHCNTLCNWGHLLADVRCGFPAIIASVRLRAVRWVSGVGGMSWSCACCCESGCERALVVVVNSTLCRATQQRRVPSFFSGSLVSFLCVCAGVYGSAVCAFFSGRDLCVLASNRTSNLAAKSDACAGVRGRAAATSTRQSACSAERLPTIRCATYTCTHTTAQHNTAQHNTTQHQHTPTHSHQRSTLMPHLISTCTPTLPTPPPSSQTNTLNPTSRSDAAIPTHNSASQGHVPTLYCYSHLLAAPEHGGPAAAGGAWDGIEKREERHELAEELLLRAVDFEPTFIPPDEVLQPPPSLALSRENSLLL